MLSVGTMMDRSSAFVMGNPPLAALHTMTEKNPALLQYQQQAAAYNSAAASSAACLATSATTTKPMCTSLMMMPPQATPHGICDILSRPDAAALNLLAPRVSPTGNRLNHPAGVYFNAAAAAAARFSAVGSSPSPASLYWHPNMFRGGNGTWQERLPCPSVSATGPGITMDKDGKKKHTRPTFSGQQIFALEKTFEQTKYLAGPERTRLAYALGMTESQVKVWFQNRRTKWRKRHAAEMASAKRKQDSETAEDLACEKGDDSIDESLEEEK